MLCVHEKSVTAALYVGNPSRIEREYKSFQ
jgi:hypothetical protein